jgi:hypothetical protein
MLIKIDTIHGESEAEFILQKDFGNPNADLFIVVVNQYFVLDSVIFAVMRKRLRAEIRDPTKRSSTHTKRTSGPRSTLRGRSSMIESSSFAFRTILCPFRNQATFLSWKLSR